MDELELYHYGVKGMKWGVRKKPNAEITAKKRQALRDARDSMNASRIDKRAKNAAYSKTFRDATRIRNQINKSRSNAYAKAATDSAEAANAADKAYKQSKKEYRKAKRDYREQKEINRFNKHGLDYNLETASTVYNYGFKAAKRIENRMANKGMSRFTSETIESGRILAKSAALTIGTVAVAGLVSAAANPKYQVMDSAGKVIRNVYR